MKTAAIFAVSLLAANAGTAFGEPHPDFDWQTVPCVDRDGQVFPIANIPEDVRQHTFQELPMLTTNAGFIVCDVRLPETETNGCYKFNIVMDSLHSGRQYGGAGIRVPYSAAFLKTEWSKPWRIRLHKPGYRSMEAPIPDDIGGKVVWMGSYTFEPYPADVTSSLTVRFVDLDRKPLPVSGQLDIGLTGGGYPTTTYSVTNGMLERTRMPPCDYHLEAKVPGYNGWTIPAAVTNEFHNLTVTMTLCPIGTLALKRASKPKAPPVDLAMGMTQHDRRDLPLDNGRKLLIAQYGTEFVFRVQDDKPSDARYVLLLKGPFDSDDAVSSLVAAASQHAYGQDGGPVREGDLMILLDSDRQILDQIEITAITPPVLRRK